MHVRLGDLLGIPGTYCELDYYRKALDQVELGDELYISSDSPQHSHVQTLMSEYKLKFLNENEEETILRASKFDNKILSLGTFSWWIGFLGNQKNVICPNIDEHVLWHSKIFPCLNWKMLNYK